MLRFAGDWLARTIGAVERKVEETRKADLASP